MTNYESSIEYEHDYEHVAPRLRETGLSEYKTISLDTERRRSVRAFERFLRLGWHVEEVVKTSETQSAMLLRRLRMTRRERRAVARRNAGKVVDL